MPARKPTKLIELKGGLKTNPGRYAKREKEPTSDREIGRPPAPLSKEELYWWRDLQKTCYKGTVFYEDRYALMEFAKVLAALNNREQKVSSGTYPLFFKFISMFGLSPADRTRLSMTKEPLDDNPFKEFVK